MKTIRVLHVVTTMNRNGLENRLMDIYRNIDRSRMQFDFLTHRKTEGHFDQEIKRLGGNVYYMEPLKVSGFFSYLKRLNKFFKSHNEYRIIHSHLNAFSTWVLMIAKIRGIPVRIAHSRIWGTSFNWKGLLKSISKIFINKTTTHKFACSRQAGEWLFGKAGIEKPNYFKVIPNSIDINKFAFNIQKREEIRAKLGLNAEELALVNVGRLTNQKNQKFAIKILYELRNLNIDAKLFIIGEGELLSFLQEEVEKYKMNEYVFFLGNIPNVYDYLNAMDAFVFPSKYEGFGTVVIEAQCNGLPTISSDSIPPETKVTDYQHFMSLKESPKEWAKKIIDITRKFEHKDCSMKVKQAGYDIKDTYIELENFYINVE